MLNFLNNFLLITLALSLPTSISGMQASLILIFFIWVYTIKNKSYISKPFFPNRIIFFVYIIVPLFSLLLAEDSAIFIKYYKRHCYILIIPLIANYFHKNYTRVILFLNIFLFSSTITSCYAIMQAFLGKNLNQPFLLKTYFVHSSAFFSNSITLAATLSYAIFISIYLFKKEKTKWIKLLYFGSIILIFTGLIFTRSRMLTLTTAFMAVLLFLFLFKKKAVLPLLIIAALVSGTHLANDRIFWRFKKPIAFEASSRKQLWKHASDAFLSSPLLGIGLGHFPLYLKKNVKDDNEKVLQFTHAHSNFLETAATTGFLGLSVFLLFWGKILFDLIKSIVLNKRETIAYTASIISIFTVFHLSGITECNLKDAEVFIPFFIFLGIFYSFNQNSKNSFCPGDPLCSEQK